MSNTPYTVQRCRDKDNPDGTPRLYGPTHGSWTGNETLCGLETGDSWFIVTNCFDGKVTCKACNKALQRKTTPYP